jgi:hypothetical protein
MRPDVLHNMAVLEGAQEAATHLLRCQYLYFCTSKASKLSNLTSLRISFHVVVRHAAPYLYFCTSKASKLST